MPLPVGGIKGGPKTRAEMSTLDLSGLAKAGPKRVEGFCKAFLSVPKGKGAKGPFVLRPWQREIVAGVFPHPVSGKRPRQGLVSLPRGNGKSTLAAALALFALYADGEEGAQVLCIASDMRQALIVFNAARRMVELSPELASRTMIYGGDDPRLYVPGTDSVMRALPATESALQGWDPSFAVVDELHVVSEEVWQSVVLAAGKRERSVVLAISTPSDSEDSVMWALVKKAREEGSPDFYFREWSAPTGCSTDDEEAWAEANPALGDFLHVDALRSTHRTTREGPWRRFRLGQWLAGGDSWLPFGAWVRVGDPERKVGAGARIVVGFDGSASGDSTALVGATVEGEPHLFVLGHWANPGDPRWRVPRGEVDERVHEVFESFEVAELAADPWGWRSEIEAWSARYPGRVIEWPTNVLSRMGPATDRFYASVLEERVTHSGDEQLAQHMAHCKAKSTVHGDVVMKARKDSPLKIDLAVAGIVAHERAMHYASRKAQRRVMSW